MAKVTIDFDMNNPDDKKLLEIMLKAQDMTGALFDIKYNLSKRLEWKLEELCNKTKVDCWDAMDIVRQEINNILENHEITSEVLDD